MPRRRTVTPLCMFIALMSVVTCVPAQSLMSRAAEQGRTAAEDSAQVNYLRAARLAQSGRYGPAIAAMNTAIEYLPNERQFKVDLAVLQATSGDVDGAIATLTAVASKTPVYPPAVMQLGDLYLAQSDTANAGAQYRRLTVGADPYPPAYVRLGDMAQGVGERAKALWLYRRALDEEPGYAEAYLRLGSMFVIEDRYGQALEMFNTALNLMPDDQTIQQMRNLAEQRKLEYEEGMAQNKMRARIIVTESEQQAREIRKKLDEGADFVSLAVNESIDPTADVGGDLGFFGPGEMIPAFENATSSLEPGEVSQPVMVPRGWAIVLRVN